MARNLSEGAEVVDGLLAASRLLPQQRATIQALLACDEEFRLLCSDLAEAQAALAQWENSSSPVRGERLVEYREIVADLSAEITTRCAGFGSE